MRIAFEHHALPRRVLLEHEGAEADELRDRRRRSPCFVEHTGFERRLQDVLWQDRKVVQEPKSRRKRRWKDDRDGARIGGHDQELFAADLHRIAQRRLVQRRERKDHIVRGERLTVGPGDAAAEDDRVAKLVVGQRPAFGEPRLRFPRGLVDADEAGLCELGDEVRAHIIIYKAVERLRIGAERGDDFAAAAQRRPVDDPALRPVCGIRRRTSIRPAARGSARENRAERDVRPNAARVSGQKLACRPKNWPPIFCTSAGIRAHFACKLAGIRDTFLEVGQLFGHARPAEPAQDGCHPSTPTSRAAITCVRGADTGQLGTARA